jgi:hypothetical protein
MQLGESDALPPSVRVTRLANSLQFANDGKIFATLRPDESGLFIRLWDAHDSPCDHIGLKATEARALLAQLFAQLR